MAIHTINRLVRFGVTTSALALMMGSAAFAQDATPQADAEADAPGDIIIVTAQRQAQRDRKSVV